MSSSTSEHLLLDWRSSPSTTALISRLEKFLGAVDSQGKASVVHILKKAAVLVEYQGNQMLLRPADSFSVHGSRDLVFWRRMYKVAVSVANLMGNSDNTMARFHQYKEASKPLSNLLASLPSLFASMQTVRLWLSCSLLGSFLKHSYQPLFSSITRR